MSAQWDETADLWYLVRQVAARFDRSGDELFRSGVDVSLAQFLVLSVVDAHPGQINQQAAGVRLGLTKGTVSRQIEKAVNAGLMTATESPHSRREKVLALTPEGTKVVRAGDALLDQNLVEHMPDLSADALRTTIETLSALNVALGGGAPPDPVNPGGS